MFLIIKKGKNSAFHFNDFELSENGMCNNSRPIKLIAGKIATTNFECNIECDNEKIPKN